MHNDVVELHTTSDAESLDFWSTSTKKFTYTCFDTPQAFHGHTDRSIKLPTAHALLMEVEWKRISKNIHNMEFLTLAGVLWINFLLSYIMSSWWHNRETRQLANTPKWMRGIWLHNREMGKKMISAYLSLAGWPLRRSEAALKTSAWGASVRCLAIFSRPPQGFRGLQPCSFLIYLQVNNNTINIFKK